MTKAVNPFERIPLWSVYLAAAALALVIYAPALRGDFLLDDPTLVVTNPTLRSPWDFQAIWATDYWPERGNSGNYRPALKQFWALERPALGVGRKTGWVIVNALLHALNAALLWRLARRLGAGAAAAGAAAALYLAHPVFVEVVVNAVGQGELLTGLALLAAWNLAAEARPVERQPARRLAAIGTILFAGFWIKEQALLFPAVVLAELLRRGVPGRRVAALGAALAAGLAGYLGARYASLGALGVDPRYLPVPFESFGERLSFLCTAAGRYAGLVAWPAALSAQYNWMIAPWREAPWTSRWALLGMAALAAWAALMIGLMARRRWRGALIAGGAAWVMLPFSHIVGVGSPMAERHLSHAMIFLALGAALALTMIAKQMNRTGAAHKALILAVILAAAALGGRSAARAAVWRDGETLWRAEAARSPHNAVARHNLSSYLFNQGRIDEAREWADAALVIWPTYSAAHHTRGLIAAAEGDPDRAAMHFRYAKEFDPFHE